MTKKIDPLQKLAQRLNKVVGKMDELLWDLTEIADAAKKAQNFITKTKLSDTARIRLGNTLFFEDNKNDRA
jgi:hypothetical protein